MKILQDKKIKKIAKEENVKAPDNFIKIIDETLSNLEEIKEPVKDKTAFKITLKIVVALVLLSFIILPNVSQEISYAMQEIPVVGNIVKAVTIRRYFEKEGKSELDMEIPNIESTADNKSSEQVNDDIEKFTQRIIDSYNEEKQEGNNLLIKVESEVLKNDTDWFTLRMRTSEVRAGSNITHKFYHIDKKKDKIVQLSDLFENENFKKAISEEIKKQMLLRMEQDENVVFWVNNEIEEWNFKEIKEDQNFYYAENGNIIIVFDKYEVAPGAMGIQEFEINKPIYEDYLKEEYK